MRDRVPRAHLCAFAQQPVRDDTARRLAHVIGVRLERQAEECDSLPAERAEVLLQLLHDAALLQLIHLPDCVEQHEGIALVAGELLEGRDIFRKTTPAEADAGAEKVRTEAMVEADAFGDVDDVGADELAHVGDLVDEADAGRQKRVGGELHQLSRRDVGANHLTVDPAVQLDDAIGVVGIERADDDTVRAREIGDGAALGEELRVRDVADVGQAPCVEARPHVRARADGHGALHHHDRPSGHVFRQLVDHRPDGGEVGVARLGRRRPDRHVQELRAVDRLPHVEREADPVAIALEHFVEPGLVDGHLARPEALDPIREDVADHHLVPEVGEARTGDEADIAGAEHADSCH